MCYGPTKNNYMMSKADNFQTQSNSLIHIILKYFEGVELPGPSNVGVRMVSFVLSQVIRINGDNGPSNFKLINLNLTYCKKSF
jgi:hypothetical protein